MSCNGERRKTNLGFGTLHDSRYKYSEKDGEWKWYVWDSICSVKEVPLSSRVYRRKCDKPPMGWVVNKIRWLESEIVRLTPKHEEITVEELRNMLNSSKKRSWRIWRRG